MADNTKLAWLAGLLEGEGCFCLRSDGHNPIVQLIMTDADVVIMAADIMGCHKVVKCPKDTRGGKQLYRTVLYGISAVDLMKSIYKYMGDRRKKKITDCLRAFENKPKYVKKYKERKSYSRGAEIVWANKLEING